MPRKVEHHSQPQIAPSAGDLGTEAYYANLRHQTPGYDSPTFDGPTAGTVPTWRHPEASNPPPGQHGMDAQEVKIGLDLPVNKAHREQHAGGNAGTK